MNLWVLYIKSSLIYIGKNWPINAICSLTVYKNSFKKFSSGQSSFSIKNSYNLNWASISSIKGKPLHFSISIKFRKLCRDTLNHWNVCDIIYKDILEKSKLKREPHLSPKWEKLWSIKFVPWFSSLHKIEMYLYQKMNSAICFKMSSISNPFFESC